MKRTLVIYIIASLLLLSGCVNKRAKQNEDTNSKLTWVSEKLESIIDDCKYAVKYGDYDSMEEELGITIVRCEDMKKIVDELVERYADR